MTTRPQSETSVGSEPCARRLWRLYRDGHFLYLVIFAFPFHPLLADPSHRHPNSPLLCHPFPLDPFYQRPWRPFPSPSRSRVCFVYHPFRRHSICGLFCFGELLPALWSSRHRFHEPSERRLHPSQLLRKNLDSPDPQYRPRPRGVELLFSVPRPRNMK